MEKNLVYPVIFTPEEEGGYCVYAPDISGCVTSADNYADGIDKIRDGIGGFALMYIDEGKSLPKPSNPAELEHGADDLVSLVDVDIEAYRRATGGKAVRRTISIPEWMDVQASREGVSLSQCLQEALRQRLA